MESGDDMSVSEKMTGLMNAVRSVSGATSKLNVNDATLALTTVMSFKYHGTITDDTKNVSDTDFNSLVENGYYHINTVLLKNMPADAQTWGTLYNLSPMGKNGYGLRIFVTSNKGIFVAPYNTSVNTTNHWSKLGGVIKPVLSAFLRPLRGGVAYAS